MAAPSYVAQGGAVTVSTACAPAYPAGLASGDLLLYFISSDSSTVGGTPAGWTSLGSAQTGGGMTVYGFKKTSDGTETGTETVSGITGGTIGVAWIAAYRPVTAGNVLSTDVRTGSDTDTSSTTWNVTAPSSWVAGVDDMIVGMGVSRAPSGSYSAGASGVALTSSSATVTQTGRFAGRTAANVLYYVHRDAAVTGSGLGLANYNGTMVGANGAGSAMFVRITESSGAVNGSVTAVKAQATGAAVAPVVVGGLLPVYVGQGTVGALTSAAVPGYPTVSAGDLILLYMFSDSSSILTPSGFSQIGSTQIGGGMNGAVFYKSADGTETGGTQHVDATGGTKGVTWMVAYRPSISTNALQMTLSDGSDTDGTSTAYAVTGSPSLTTTPGDLLTVSSAVLTAGAYTGNGTSLNETQSGATLDTLTARFSGRAQTNTVWYHHADSRVAVGGTGAPGLTATTVGANGTGTSLFLRLHEVLGTSVNVNAVAATATGVAKTNVVLAGGIVLAAVAATATGAAIGAGITGQLVVTDGGPAIGTGTVIVPSVGVDFSIVAVAATGTGLAPVPGVVRDYVIVSPVATGTGLVRKPIPGVDLTVTQVPVATATGQAYAPTLVLSDLFLTAVRATGTATALVPFLDSTSAGFVFTPPGHKHKHPLGNTLFQRLTYTEGMSVVNNGGFFTTKQYLGDDEIAAATKVYIGGHKYPLSDQERIDLIAAGYGDYITQENIT